MSSRKHSFNFGVFADAADKTLDFLDRHPPIGVVVGMATFVGLVIGCVFVGGSIIDYAISDSAKVVSARKDFQKAKNDLRIGDNLYKIADQDTVVYKAQNGEHVNSYNFELGLVTVDGPDKADRVFTFSEYKNPHNISTALNTGCTIGRKIPSLYEQFKDVLSDDFADSKINEYAPTFAQKYCNDAYISQFPQLKLESK